MRYLFLPIPDGLLVLVPRLAPRFSCIVRQARHCTSSSSTTAQWHGLDPALVKALVIKCESGFDPWAQSPKGAQGLMQLMPSTQTMLGVGNPFNPQRNVEAGARYTACSSRRSAVTCSSLSLPIMLDRRPWSPLATVPAIAETQQYVRCVFAAYEQYRQSRAAPFLPDLRPLQPGARTLAPSRRSLTPSVEARQTLIVSPLRLSSQVAQVGATFDRGAGSDQYQ